MPARQPRRTRRPPVIRLKSDERHSRLRGFLGATACLIHQPFLLAVAGGVFVLEAASVILQVAWFRRTGGRRLFLMTPIHHHFQKKGWPTTKLVVRFWILSFLCGLLGLLSLKLR